MLRKLMLYQLKEQKDEAMTAANQATWRVSGFSIVEVMIVVAIISLLSALAIPRFKSFQAKAKAAEVVSNLRHIYSLEIAHRAETDSFISMPKVGWSSPGTCTNTNNELGFYVRPCDKTTRYTYEVPAGTTTSVSYTSRGTSGINTIIPNCSILDIWESNEKREKVHVSDPIVLCP